LPLVAIALGSNLGDRQAHLAWATASLGALLTDLRVSSAHETPAEDVPDNQPEYLNAVAVGHTDLLPETLLSRLMALEAARGRVRDSLRAARTLDLDLILYGDWVVNGPGLTIPHPRFRERRFVLAPLAEVAPDLRDPMTGQSMAALLGALDGGPVPPTS
jgi:2-amino-4-hydroxy-6-hydroxymethyldihydropteridine diphosphokinase